MKKANPYPAIRDANNRANKRISDLRARRNESGDNL